MAFDALSNEQRDLIREKTTDSSGQTILLDPEQSFARAVSRVQEMLLKHRHMNRFAEADLDFLQTVIYHDVISFGKARKYNLEQRHADHDRRVTEQCLSYYWSQVKRYPEASMASSWLLHDAIEEYGVSFEDVETMCGKNTRQSVKLNTVPSDPVLAKLFGVPEEMTPIGKMRVKNHFKIDQARAKTIGDIILRMHDNPDALIAYVWNIQKREILIQDIPETIIADSIKIFPRAQMHVNLFYREKYNEALMDRARDIADDMENAARLNPHGIDIRRLIRDGRMLFSIARSRFEQAAGIPHTVTFSKHVNDNFPQPCRSTTQGFCATPCAQMRSKLPELGI